MPEQLPARRELRTLLRSACGRGCAIRSVAAAVATSGLSLGASVILVGSAILALADSPLAVATMTQKPQCVRWKRKPSNNFGGKNECDVGRVRTSSAHSPTHHTNHKFVKKYLSLPSWGCGCGLCTWCYYKDGGWQRHAHVEMSRSMPFKPRLGFRDRVA